MVGKAVRSSGDGRDAVRRSGYQAVRERFGDPPVPGEVLAVALVRRRRAHLESIPLYSKTTGKTRKSQSVGVYLATTATTAKKRGRTEESTTIRTDSVATTTP
ncbi:hypothetical protein [Halorussus salinisoli]|uniref:hypothetical protein n=1 Tax=Halorussus salinisoli TaxID=2558242 RepID=UPI0010C1ECB5|nr:hypothetical protein [Halorussus salinisoli]